MTETAKAKPIGVVLVEDDPHQCAAIARTLRRAADLELLAVFASAEEAEAAIATLAPDVVLVDIGLPGRSGTELVRALKPSSPNTEFMMLTVVENPTLVFEALAAGASGYLLKQTEPERLVEAVVELHHGAAPMSTPIARLVILSFRDRPPRPAIDDGLAPREREVLERLAQGWTYKGVAEATSLSLGTVRTYVKRIYAKLHVHNRVEAMRATGRTTRTWPDREG